jgi:hypothetical protein
MAYLYFSPLIQTTSNLLDHHQSLLLVLVNMFVLYWLQKFPYLPIQPYPKLNENYFIYMNAWVILEWTKFNNLHAMAIFGESLKCIGSCDKPLCHACCLGKAHKRPIPTDNTPLKASHLHAGDCVSCDQLESNAPGWVATLKGKPSKDSYHACTFS